MRDKLDDLMNAGGGENWWKQDLFQENSLAELPKELEVVTFPPRKEENYNCFLYALGLFDVEEIRDDCDGFLYDTFIQKLLYEEELQYTQGPKSGDYILYRNSAFPGMISHIGILEESGTVISKWSWGPTLRHKTFDVPKMYGDNVAYISQISKQKACQLYEKYKEWNTFPTETS